MGIKNLMVQLQLRQDLANRLEVSDGDVPVVVGDGQAPTFRAPGQSQAVLTSSLAAG